MCHLSRSLCGIKGLMAAGVFIFALMFAFGQRENEEITSINTKSEISETQRFEPLEQQNSSTITINLDNHSSSAFAYLIQLLFWAFFISPPIIVVLLLVIIKKMNDKNSVK